MPIYKGYEFSTSFAGRSITPDINPRIQKEATYRILRNKYEEQKAKYDRATPAYKETAEYERLERIVKRLRVIVAQLEKDLGH